MAYSLLVEYLVADRSMVYVCFGLLHFSINVLPNQL